MNPKSKLQELIQKNNGSVPQYVTQIDEQESKKPMFKSFISYTFDNVINTITTNHLFFSKKEAEKHIAKKAIKKILKSVNSKYNSNIANKNNITVFIDYENYADDHEIELFKNNTGINVMRVANKNHPKVDNTDIITNSTRSDASDVLIICKVAETFMSNKNAIVFVVTRDHFAEVLADLYPNCHRVVSIEQCYNEILTLIKPAK